MTAAGEVDAAHACHRIDYEEVLVTLHDVPQPDKATKRWRHTQE